MEIKLLLTNNWVYRSCFTDTNDKNEFKYMHLYFNMK